MVAVDTSRGQYLLIWRDLRSDTDGDIYGQLIAADKSLSGSEFVVSAMQSCQKEPALVYNAQQDIYLALWRDYRNGGPELYVQFILPGGTLSGSNLALYQDLDFEQISNYGFEL